MPNVTELEINGSKRRVDVVEERPLLGVLREDLGLTGTKYGCGEGQCGACTVLVDGVPTRSCITKVATIGSKQISTVEGLEKDAKLHLLQEAFIKADAMQCAYCTSGMLMSAYALLQKQANPSDQEIIRAMNGNICRCGAYSRIMEAIRIASKNITSK